MTDGPPGSILIVDDDAEIREALATMLVEEGYPVRTAINGVDAFNVLEEMDPPSMILLDLTMPIMDGQSFWERLQQRKSEIPVVIVSAVGHRAPAHLGVVDKPIDFEGLMRYVRQYCGLTGREPTAATGGG